MKRGDIYCVDFGAADRTHKQKGIRPAVIISNNKNNDSSPVVTVVPLTSRRKRPLPTHVPIRRDYNNGLTKTSVALAEQIETMDKTRLKRRIGEITDDVILEAITVAVMVQVGVYDEYN